MNLSKKEFGILLMGLGCVGILVMYILIISIRRAKKSELNEVLINDKTQQNYIINPMHE